MKKWLTGLSHFLAAATRPQIYMAPMAAISPIPLDVRGHSGSGSWVSNLIKSCTWPVVPRSGSVFDPCQFQQHLNGGFGCEVQLLFWEKLIRSWWCPHGRPTIHRHLLEDDGQRRSMGNSTGWAVEHFPRLDHPPPLYPVRECMAATTSDSRDGYHQANWTKAKKVLLNRWVVEHASIALSTTRNSFTTSCYCAF